MLKKIISLSLFIVILSNINAQDNISVFLDSIKRNNPTLKAARLNLAKEEVGFKTGLTLPNPELEYNHMFLAEGNEGITEVVVAQPFDLPFKYLIQNNLANSNIEGAKLAYKSFEQEFLLQAKLKFLELISLNKTINELQQRSKHANIVLDSYIKLVKQGETSIVELNKIKLFVLSIDNQVANAELQLSNLKIHLTELNNGMEPYTNDSIFPSVEELIDFKDFKDDYFNSDVEIAYMHANEEIAKKELRLSRTSRLPSMALGYKLEKAPNEQLNGFHFGLTIPLWEHKNKVKYAKSNYAYSSFEVEKKKHVKNFELQSLYDSYIAKKQLLERYSVALRDFDNEELLDLSLKTGNISVIEYLMELSMIYETIDEYLDIEKEYHLIVAELTKYKL